MFQITEAEYKEFQELRLTVKLIDQLRTSEGDSINILCADPEADEELVYVDACGEWTDWKDKRFVGKTLLLALQNCLANRMDVPPKGTENG